MSFYYSVQLVNLMYNVCYMYDTEKTMGKIVKWRKSFLCKFDGLNSILDHLTVIKLGIIIYQDWWQSDENLPLKLCKILWTHIHTDKYVSRHRDRWTYTTLRPDRCFFPKVNSRRISYFFLKSFVVWAKSKRI